MSLGPNSDDTNAYHWPNTEPTCIKVHDRLHTYMYAGSQETINIYYMLKHKTTASYKSQHAHARYEMRRRVHQTIIA